MRILSLRANNVFSLSEVRVNLRNKGLVLVTGFSKDENSCNGAGKSSLANKAIVWGLFGQTAGGIRGDDVINRHGGKKAKAFVEISFEGVDGLKYEVMRSRNPNALELYQNNTRLTKRHEKETQVLINQALGRDYTTFLQADFFGQGRTKSYPALTPKEQKEVLEQILPIEKLTLWSDRAKEEKSKLSKLNYKLSLDLSKLQGRCEEAEAHLCSVIERSSKWDQEHQDRLEKADKKLQETQLQSEKISRRLSSIDTKLLDMPDPREIEEQVISKNQKIITSNLEINKLNERIASAEERTNKWQEYKDSLERKLALIDEGKCVTCEQEFTVSDETLRTLQVEAAEATTKLADCYTIKQGALYTKSLYDGSIADYTEQIEQLSNTKKEREKLRLEAAELRAMPILTDLRLAKQNYNNTAMEKNPYGMEEEHAVLAVSQLKDEIEDLEANISNVKSHEIQLTFWVEAFSKKMRNYMLNKACPFLEQRTAKHLQGLRNSQLQVSFSTVKLLKSGDSRDDFNVNVESTSGGRGFQSLSGGEQQMVSFAVGLALADLAETQVEGSSHFLILDEPFVELDAKNQESLVDYLNEVISKKRETILMVSNDLNLKSLISRNLHVVKENGVTKLEELNE